ncbi:MAG: hypothetical protein O3C40_03770 [Planctomycetota bacterium]|nr:hypothetical protein [Planctomycetota bacterium]
MFVALTGLWYLLAIACGIASLVFFILVLVQMFKRDQSTLGIVCIVLSLCSGIGVLVAFVYGWMKATEWNLKKIMTYWTVAFVLYFIFLILAVASFFAAAATMVPQDMNFDPNNMDIQIEMDGTDFSFSDDSSMPEDAPEVDYTPSPEESSTDQP